MNSVILIGRLTKDPEVRYMPQSETAVATFTLAVDRVGAKEKTADFLRIVCFGKTAEAVEKYTEKGKRVGIDGRIQTSNQKDSDGSMRYFTDVVAERVEFLEWKDKDESQQSRPSNERPTQEKPPTNVPEGFQALEDDDDVPF